jgi:DNA-binding beta-propeller fold protein YncE
MTHRRATIPTTLRFLALKSFRSCVAVALLGSGVIVPVAAGHGAEHRRTKDQVWVTNRDQGTIMVFDAVSGDAVTPEPVLVGPGVHDIVVSSLTRQAFVSDDASRVYVLSTITRDLIDTVEFNAGSRPHHLSLSHDGKTVYVGLFAGNNIAAIDVRTHDVVEMSSSTVPGTTAHAPEPSPDDRFIFVPHEGQNLVTRVSRRTGRIREVTLGTAANSSPSEVLPTRDGETLFVSMRIEDTIRTIDLDTFTATVDPLPVGDAPESLILTPGERTLIVSLRGTPARLAFVDTDSFVLEQTLDIAGAGTFGDLAVASPDGRFVYAVYDAAAAGQGGVAKVDVRTRIVVETMPYPGLGRPHGIAYLSGRTRK